jgi:CHRD domain
MLRLPAAAALLSATLAATPAASQTTDENRHPGGAADPRSPGEIRLLGVTEVPTTVTAGRGTAELRVQGRTILYRLRYDRTEGVVTQAHIHVGQEGTTGGIAAFLCSNAGNGPPGTPACPASGAVSGVITAEDVVATAAGQGVAEGEIGDLIRAVRDGAVYVNVHSDKFPAGEIRGDARR